MSAIPYSTFEQDFKFEKNLGQGNCATVAQVYHKVDKQNYAHKKIIVPTNEELTQAFNQIESVRLIDDEKATKIYYYYTYHNKQKGNYQLGIIMELCKQSLSQLIKLRKKKNSYYKTEDLRVFLSSLVPFFSKMQKKGILHRDIKPDNILLARTKKTDYRVADFGFAIKQNAYSSRNVAGTMQYVSPKLLVKFKDHKIAVSGHTIKDDVYSFGKTLTQFMTLQINGSFSPKKISQCVERYGRQYTNVILMTTKQSQQQRIDFVLLEEYLLSKNLIQSAEKYSPRQSFITVKPRNSRDSQGQISPARSKESDTMTKTNSKEPRGNSFVKKQVKTKRKLTPDKVETIVKKEHIFHKKLFRQWDKKVIPLKEQISCMQICDTLLFLGLQDKLGIMLLSNSKLVKFSNVNSFKEIYCIKLSQDNQQLLVGTLHGKLCCIPIVELKKLMLNNNDSLKLKNSFDINLEGLKCKEYLVTAPISTFECIYPEAKADPIIIIGHYTGDITLISNNRIQRKVTFCTEPITHIALSEGIVYTSNAQGIFKRQPAISIGLPECQNKGERIRETYFGTFKNHTYKCQDAIATFKIVSNCKRNQQIKKQNQQYLAVLVCWNGMIHIVSKSLSCERFIRIAPNNILGTFFNPCSSEELGLEGYLIDDEGTIFDLHGKIVAKTEEKNVVCLISSGQNIYCGGFDRKVIALKAKDIIVQLQ